jgi:hypothetical protein
MTADDDHGWRASGDCASVDPELWYPEKGGSVREAKRICGGCPIKVECLAWALDHAETFGVWGGLSERERRRLKRPGTRERRQPMYQITGGTYRCPEPDCSATFTSPHGIGPHRYARHGYRAGAELREAAGQ